MVMMAVGKMENGCMIASTLYGPKLILYFNYDPIIVYYKNEKDERLLLWERCVI